MEPGTAVPFREKDRSVLGVWRNPASASAPRDYKEARSITLDTQAFYFVGGCRTDLEDMISRTSLSAEKIDEARHLISLIIGNNISKYNAQTTSARTLDIDRGALVIEQSYDDQSLAMGCADADVFARMLSDAVRENPGKPVYFKRHPDNCAREKQIDFRIPPGVRVVKDVSPLDLLQYVDRVYVATSQLGFEALMLGKRVNPKSRSG